MKLPIQLVVLQLQFSFSYMLCRLTPLNPPLLDVALHQTKIFASGDPNPLNSFVERQDVVDNVYILFTSCDDYLGEIRRERFQFSGECEGIQDAVVLCRVRAAASYCARKCLCREC